MGSREKEELNEAADTKIEDVIAELQLQGCHPTPETAEQRIIDGFTYFKIHNFEYTHKLIKKIHYLISLCGLCDFNLLYNLDS